MYFPNGFDRPRAIQLAGLVQQAYRQMEAFEKNEPWSLDPDFSMVAELRYLEPDAVSGKGLAASFEKELRQLAKARPHKRTEGLPIGFIARRRSDAYLVFRGTMTTTEWIRDFTIRLTPYPYGGPGRVHDGFIKSYAGFRKTIQEGLAGIRGARRLFISGHSLGAALATLAGPDIASTTSFKAPIVYTFASPRAGDNEFAAQYNEAFKGRSFRIANTSDLVVSMPFPVPFLGFLGGYFTHVDTPVDFTVQKEDAEKNHDLGTYLEALTAGAGRRGLLRQVFG